MKLIAVVGFSNLKDFRDWAYERIIQSDKDHLLGKDYYVNETEKIEYRCILCEKDLIGKRFDDYIEVDNLRLSLKKRVR